MALNPAKTNKAVSEAIEGLRTKGRVQNKVAAAAKKIAKAEQMAKNITSRT